MFHESPPPKFITEVIPAKVRVGNEHIEDIAEMKLEEENMDYTFKENKNTEIGVDQDVSQIDENTEMIQDDTKDLTYVPEEQISIAPVERILRPKTKNINYRLFSNVACRSESSEIIDEPKVLSEISKRSDAEKWNSAIQEELNSLHENGTWELVNLPKGEKALKTKWVFKLKRDCNNEIIRYKARLVAKGFTQREGIDYDETFAPVVRYASIRFLIALAVEHNLQIDQMDAITAFLQGDIEENIYVEQPEGLADGTQRVYKLKKAMYGLKQAGRQWNLKLEAALESFGLKKSKMDPCVYFNDNLSLMVAIYVDDILIFWREKATMEKLKSSLSSMFRMKDMGIAETCVGIKIKHTSHGISLDQCSYIEEILKRFDMHECKPVGTPSDSNVKLSAAMITDDDNEIKIPYQEAVGSLLYLAQCTRPDIAFSVNDVSRFNAKYGIAHWRAVKRIFRYLRGTSDLKLHYTRSKIHEIKGFSDADWASDVDKRRSCTGYVFQLSNAAVTWCSKRQHTVALSSTEAEYMAISAAIQEGIWLKQLGDELDPTLRKPVELFCDNESTIKLTKLDAYRPRTKHIDVRYHFARDMIRDGQVNIHFTKSEGNVADALTKATTRQKHDFCVEKIGLKV